MKRLRGETRQNDPPKLFTCVTNPLLVPCILELVLSSLPIPDLRSSRTVCSTWNHEINRFLKKLKSVKIQGDQFQEAEEFLASNKAVSYLSQLQSKECSTSNPTFEKLLIWRGKYLHQLVLDKCKLDVQSFLNLMSIEAFPHLSILTLKQNEYVDHLGQGRRTVFITNGEDQPVLRYLKSLEIDERGPNSRTTLKNIALICPNLQRLTYSNCPVPNLVEFRNPRTFNLNSLDFLQLAPIDGRKMDHQYFEALTNLRLKKLKTLFLYGMNPGGKKRMKSLQNFIKSVSSTLLSMHLGQRIMFNPEYQAKVPSPFPVSLPNLKRMSIGPGFIHSLKALDKTPSLTSFTCSRISAGDWLKILKQGIPNKHESVLSLDLGDIGHIPLTILSPAFPNLVRLEVNVCRVENHDAVARAIFGGFPKLQMFNIYDVTNQNLLTDSGITGMSAKDCDKSSRSKSKKIQPRRVHPYVGDLKSLIDLRLQYLSGKLTDLSVLHGIIDVPSLFALDLSKSQITDASLSVLATCAHNLSVLYIRDCPNISEQGKTKFRELRPNVQLRS